MLYTGQKLAFSRAVAAQPIGHDHPRRVLQGSQQFAEEPVCGSGIASALHQDVEHMAMLIDRAPEVMQYAADADEHLIEVPFVTRPHTAPFQFDYAG